MWNQGQAAEPIRTRTLFPWWQSPARGLRRLSAGRLLAAALLLTATLLLAAGIAAAAPGPGGGPPDASAAHPSGSSAAPVAATGEPPASTSLLAHRLEQWPAWRLPAPLSRPARQAPPWPDWFAGEWQVSSTTLSSDDAAMQPATTWQARFLADGRGGAVPDRAFNALSAGRSLLGAQLLSVEDDPLDPRRQLARLAEERFLETTLIGLRDESPAADLFLNDELSLLVMHGARGTPSSRIETLGRWRRLPDGSIAGEQWQARYGSPADGLRAVPLGTEHVRLRLVPVPPGSGRAS